MQNMPFVIWMLGFPLVVNVCEYLYALTQKMNDVPPLKSSDEVELVVGVLWIAIWVLVGRALFIENKSREQAESTKSRKAASD